MRIFHILAGAAITCSLQAAVILQGTASGPGQVAGSGEYADVSISYLVESVAANTINTNMNLSLNTYYKYSYTFSDPATPNGVDKKGKPVVVNPRDFSHIIIGLSSGCASDPECIFGIQPSSTLLINTYSDSTQGASNPGLTVPLYGNKFDGLNSATFAVSFYSNRQIDPQGRVYGKGGDAKIGSGKLWFQSVAGAVATPDTVLVDQAPVPEPTTLGLMGSALVGLALWTRNRRHSKE